MRVSGVHLRVNGACVQRVRRMLESYAKDEIVILRLVIDMAARGFGGKNSKGVNGQMWLVCIVRGST